MSGKTLTVREVAADLRVSKSSVYRLIDNDELLGIKIGGSVRIPSVAYDRYCRERGIA